MPGRRGLHLLAIQRGMLLVEQGVEHTFALLKETDPPASGTNGMHYNSFWDGNSVQIMLKQREVEIGILAPRGSETLIEAAGL